MKVGCAEGAGCIGARQDRAIRFVRFPVQFLIALLSQKPAGAAFHPLAANGHAAAQISALVREATPFPRISR